MFPGGSDSKQSACSVGGLDLIPGLGRSPAGGHGNPLQYSCLENPMDRGAWWLGSLESQRVRHNWATTHTHNDVEYLFMRWLAICLSVLERCLYMFFACFELGCFCCCWVAGVLYLLWILISYQTYRINIFSHSVGCILFWFHLCPV